jgi:hypothetical protein
MKLFNDKYNISNYLISKLNIFQSIFLVKNASSKYSVVHILLKRHSLTHNIFKFEDLNSLDHLI